MLSPADETKALDLALRAALAYQAGDYAGVSALFTGPDANLALEGLLALLGSYGRQAHGDDWLPFLQQATALRDAENILNEVSLHG